VQPAHDRLPHFRLEFTPSSGEELQTEYFVRFSDGADALRAVARLRARIAPLLHITEVRAVAADALWMSMCFERESLAIHFTWKAMPAEVAALLPDIEAALAPFAPRPHWGKLFAMRDVGRLYPRLDDFRALCAEHDPSGKFASQWLREVGVVA
jgi:xylitol oxidase